jgi:hypothetical protein
MPLEGHGLRIAYGIVLREVSKMGPAHAEVAESGATRAVVQLILLCSSRSPRGDMAAHGSAAHSLAQLTATSSGVDDFRLGNRFCDGICRWVEPDSNQAAG